MDAALVLARLIAYAAGSVLFGVPLFALFSRVALARLKVLLALSGLSVALAAVAGLVVQTGQMAGDPRAGFDPATLHDVIGSAFGLAVGARLAAGFAASAVSIAMRPGRRLWTLSVALGAVALGALPWSGHGAADQGAAGALHLLADVAHLLAAGIWLGALAAFVLLLTSRRSEPAEVRALHGALKGFSGVGSAVVAVIVASGLMNGWFLVGPAHLNGLRHTLWGELLLIKLALFLVMLALACLNRFRLTPRLEAALAGRPGAAVAALRRSVALEAALGLAVLVLVAVLGTQPPPTG